MSNELNEKIFRSVDTIVSARLQNLPFDQTIVGVIKDVLLENGIHKYIIDYKGALLVVFYNNEEKVYNIDDEVYVLIPQGDFTAKKLITGIVINNYKTEGKDDSKTFFASQAYVDSSNEFILHPTSTQTTTLKNILPEQSFIDGNSNGIIGYTVLRFSYHIAADLYIANQNLNSGKYGLKISIIYKDQNTEKLETRTISQLISNNEMLLMNPYKTGGYVSQYFDIDIKNKIITDIKVDIWQDGKFKKDDSDKIDNPDDFEIKFRNLKIIAGYYKENLSSYDTDNLGAYLYPVGSLKYYGSKSESERIRTLGIRIINRQTERVVTYTNPIIYLFIYLKNHMDNHDIYGRGWKATGTIKNGIYQPMELLKNKNDEFSYVLPTGDQIKECPLRVQIQVKDPLTGNILTTHSEPCIFDNGSYIDNVGLLDTLNMIPQNNDNTFYIYGQDNQLLARSNGEKIHNIAVEFNSRDSSKEYMTLAKGIKLTYSIPATNTMILPVEPGIAKDSWYTFEHILEEGDNASIYNKIESGLYYIPFKIASLYNPLYKNNTIKCSIEINNQTYSNSIDLLFGNSGSTGADCVLQLSLYKKNGLEEKEVKMVRPLKDNTYLIKANLYGYAWEALNKLNLSYKWYYNSLNNETKVKLTDKGEITFKENLNSNDTTLMSKLVIVAEGTYNMNTIRSYITLPCSFNDKYVCADGCSIVTYDITGKKPVYEKTPYKLYKLNNKNSLEVIPNVKWTLEGDGAKFWNFNKDNNMVIPPTIYSTSNNIAQKNLYVQGVNSKQNNELFWIQPIIMINNNYPIAMWNDIKGKDIFFKNLKLLSTTVGQLNDTQESGILMGTFSKTDEENNTYTTYGLYGVFQNNIIFELTDSGIARIALSDTSKTSQQLIDNIGVGYTVGSEIQPVYFANGIPKLGKTYVSLDNYNSQIKDLQDKNEELQTTITNLQTTITNLQTIITNLQKRVEILEKAKS